LGGRTVNLEDQFQTLFEQPYMADADLPLKAPTFAELVEAFCLGQAEMRARLAQAAGGPLDDPAEGTKRERGALAGGP